MRGRLIGTEVRAAVLAVLIARTAVNGSHRVVYPFLPEIARGLGVSLATLGGLLALRAAVGLGAPLVPAIAERLGRRLPMLAGLGAATAGCLVVAGVPGLPAAAVGFLLVGTAKPLFDVPMQSWFGDRVPYHRRGRVIGVVELTWAASLALALPAGYLIAVTSWRAPFLLVAALGLAGIVAVGLLMRGDRPARRVRRPLRLTRPLVALLGVVLLFRMAAEMLFLVYGAWLEADFGLTVTAIGAFTLVVVAAELAGEGGVAAFADRIGLKRSILAGLGGMTVTFACLGLVGSSLGLAVVAVVAWFATFELTIVATVVLATEVAAEARDRLLSLVAAVAVGSGAVSALAAPHLFAAGGIRLTGLVSAACAACAWVLLAAGVPAPARAR